MLTDCIDALNHWLATEGLPPAQACAGGALRFDTRSGNSLAARRAPDGRVELFSSPGHAGEQMLRALIDDADDGEGPDMAGGEATGLLPLLAWRDEGMHGSADDSARWHAEIRLADGLIVLARTAKAPESAQEWSSCTQAFERACAEWAGMLSPVPVADGGVARCARPDQAHKTPSAGLLRI